MDEFKHIIEQGLEAYGELYVQILKEELIGAKKDTTGTLINSLRAEVKEVVDGYVLEIESEDYLKYVDEGRKRGSYAPIKAIQTWVSIKRIQARDKKGRFLSYRQTAFAVNQSIYKNGIKPTNVIEKTNNKIQQDVIEKAFGEYLEAVIFSEFEKL